MPNEEFVEIDGDKFKADPENPGEALNDDEGNPIPFEEKVETEKPKGETVPLATHLKLKDKYGKLEKALEAARQSAPGTPLSEQTIETLANEHNVEPSFIRDLLTVMAKEADQKISKIEADRQRDKVEQAFNSEFESLTRDYPKLASKKDIVKKLAFDPDNKDKTLEEVAIEAFGDLLGRPSSESSRPSSGRDIDTTKIDFDNMTPEEKKKVMGDPVLKDKYFKHLDEQHK
jgi:hypothetical protein